MAGYGCFPLAPGVLGHTGFPSPVSEPSAIQEVGMSPNHSLTGSEPPMVYSIVRPRSIAYPSSTLDSLLASSGLELGWQQVKDKGDADIAKWLVAVLRNYSGHDENAKLCTIQVTVRQIRLALEQLLQLCGPQFSGSLPSFPDDASVTTFSRGTAPIAHASARLQALETELSRIAQIIHLWSGSPEGPGMEDSVPGKLESPLRLVPESSPVSIATVDALLQGIFRKEAEYLAALERISRNALLRQEEREFAHIQDADALLLELKAQQEYSRRHAERCDEKLVASAVRIQQLEAELRVANKAAAESSVRHMKLAEQYAELQAQYNGEIADYKAALNRFREQIQYSSDPRHGDGLVPGEKYASLSAQYERIKAVLQKKSLFESEARDLLVKYKLEREQHLGELHTAKEIAEEMRRARDQAEVAITELQYERTELLSRLSKIRDENESLAESCRLLTDSNERLQDTVAVFESRASALTASGRSLQAELQAAWQQSELLGADVRSAHQQRYGEMWFAFFGEESRCRRETEDRMSETLVMLRHHAGLIVTCSRRVGLRTALEAERFGRQTIFDLQELSRKSFALAFTDGVAQTMQQAVLASQLATSRSQVISLQGELQQQASRFAASLQWQAPVAENDAAERHDLHQRVSRLQAENLAYMSKCNALAGQNSALQSHVTNVLEKLTGLIREKESLIREVDELRRGSVSCASELSSLRLAAVDVDLSTQASRAASVAAEVPLTDQDIAVSVGAPGSALEHSVFRLTELQNCLEEKVAILEAERVNRNQVFKHFRTLFCEHAERHRQDLESCEAAEFLIITSLFHPWLQYLTSSASAVKVRTRLPTVCCSIDHLIETESSDRQLIRKYSDLLLGMVLQNTALLLIASDPSSPVISPPPEFYAVQEQHRHFAEQLFRAGGFQGSALDPAVGHALAVLDMRVSAVTATLTKSEQCASRVVAERVMEWSELEAHQRASLLDVERNVFLVILGNFFEISEMLRMQEVVFEEQERLRGCNVRATELLREQQAEIDDTSAALLDLQEQNTELSVKYDQLLLRLHTQVDHSPRTSQGSPIFERGDPIIRASPSAVQKSAVCEATRSFVPVVEQLLRFVLPFRADVDRFIQIFASENETECSGWSSLSSLPASVPSSPSKYADSDIPALLRTLGLQCIEATESVARSRVFLHEQRCRCIDVVSRSSRKPSPVHAADNGGSPFTPLVYSRSSSSLGSREWRVSPSPQPLFDSPVGRNFAITFMLVFQEAEERCRGEIFSCCNIVRYVICEMFAEILTQRGGFDQSLVEVAALRNEALVLAEQCQATAKVYCGLRDSAVERVRFLEAQVLELGKQLEMAKQTSTRWMTTAHVEREEAMSREHIEVAFAQGLETICSSFEASVLSGLPFP